jgi:hypothetical protein
MTAAKCNDVVEFESAATQIEILGRDVRVSMRAARLIAQNQVIAPAAGSAGPAFVGCQNEF